jgi:beta-glucanase (GH16 family)
MIQMLYSLRTTIIVIGKAFLTCLFTLTVFTSSASDWKLVWADEFDKPGLPDPAKWSYETGFVRNREMQYYTDSRLENARVENGYLVIEAQKERFKNPAFNPAADPQDWMHSREFAIYTSASLTTQEHFNFKYGRIEVRAKLPAGRGVWPAIWMLGTNITSVSWPRCGEIDIMEMVGFEPDMIYGHIHTFESITKQNIKDGTGIEVPGASDDFHVYAIEWDASQISFFADNKKYYTYQNPKTDGASWPFDRDQYLILNLAIGGAWGGTKGIDDTIFPQRFYIDYVRIYQREP